MSFRGKVVGLVVMVLALGFSLGVIAQPPGAGAEERALAGIQTLIDADKLKPGTVLKVMHHSGQRAQIEPLLEEFNRLTGLKAESVVIGYEADIYTKAMHEAVVRTGEYALFLTFCNWVGDMAEAGLILPLDDWMGKYDPEIHTGPDAFVKPLNMFTTMYAGRHYAIGMDNDAFVLFYRKDLMEDPEEQRRFQEQYGRPLTFPETWEELEEVVEFFDRPEEGMRGAHLYATRQFAYTSWAPRFVSKGGIYFDPNTMDPLIDTPEGLEALQEMISLAHEHMSSEVYTSDWSGAYTRFPEGKAFCAAAWGSLGQWAEDPASSQIAGKVGFATLPGTIHDGVLYQATPHVVGWSLSVSRYGPMPEAAYLLAQWLASPTVSAELIKLKGTLDPFRLSHFRDVELLETYGVELGPVLKANAEQSFPDIALRGASEYIDILNINLQLAVAGLKDPKKALEETANAWQEITERLGRGGQIEAWQETIKAYPAHIRELWEKLGKI